MADFLTTIQNLAVQSKKTIVLPEGNDSRVIEAAKILAEKEIVDVIVLSEQSDELSSAGVKVIDNLSSDKRDEYADALFELRKHKGISREDAANLLDDPLYFATMMVKQNDADGMVAGALNATANVLRPALQILKTAPDSKLVSSFFVMQVPDCNLGEHGTFIFADCAINEDPDAEALSEIALASAESCKAFLDATPRVAFLSYSTKGSAKSDAVEKVVRAVEIAKDKNPKLALDGELQLDAAIIPEVAKLKAPDSQVAGSANVLIFPGLESANIGYKLVQRLAGAEAFGPILQGLAAPVNDLSRGCSVDDIVSVSAITAVQCQKMKQRP